MARSGGLGLSSSVGLEVGAAGDRASPRGRTERAGRGAPHPPRSDRPAPRRTPARGLPRAGSRPRPGPSGALPPSSSPRRGGRNAAGGPGGGPAPRRPGRGGPRPRPPPRLLPRSRAPSASAAPGTPLYRPRAPAALLPEPFSSHPLLLVVPVPIFPPQLLSPAPLCSPPFFPLLPRAPGSQPPPNPPLPCCPPSFLLPPRFLFPACGAPTRLLWWRPLLLAAWRELPWGPGDGAVALPQALSPLPLGAQEQSAPCLISGLRSETFRRPGPGGLRLPRICLPPTSIDTTPGVGVTAALLSYLPAPPKITRALPVPTPNPEVSLGPGDGQMAVFNRTVPFCWGPKQRPGQFT